LGLDRSCDLGESMTLADRIMVFSAGPGRIKDRFEVDFEPPRRRKGAQDARLRRIASKHLAFAQGGIRQAAQRMRRSPALPINQSSAC
jgi:ABC-type nitrate/sulfonate/bicarbonate transport system ATPase subunit